MGLDASVSCTCYGEGRASPPPVPPELIVVDDDGWIELNLPYDGNEERFAQFDGWRYTACGHEDMAAARVRVSNWSGYRAFQQALGQAGWGRFPTLREELPNANQGSTDAAAARRALEELAAFRAHDDLGHDWFLVDGNTGEVVHRYIAVYDGKLIFGGASGVDVGFDDRGLFVVTRTQPPRELFRAMRLEQRLLDPSREAAGGGPGPVELVDLDTGRRMECPVAVADRQIPWPDGRMLDDDGRIRSTYPRRLQVERRAITAAEFEYVLRPLEEVFQAAVATGNPVRWT
jgi:hypothetical protein